MHYLVNYSSILRRLGLGLTASAAVPVHKKKGKEFTDGRSTMCMTASGMPTDGMVRAR